RVRPVQHRRLVRAGESRHAISGSHRTGLPDGPVRDEAIAADAPVQCTAGLAAVHVGNVLGNAHAQPVEVEVSVAGHERVEGPVHAHDAEATDGFALKLLEVAPDPVIAEFGSYGEHVGPVDQVTPFDAGEAEDEADQAVIAVEGAGGDAADALGHLENGGGDPFVELRAPGFVLEGDAGVVFGRGAEVPDLQSREV